MNSLRIALHLAKRVLGSRWRLVIFVLLPPMLLGMIIGLLGNESMKPVKLDVINQDTGGLGQLLQQEVSGRHYISITSATSRKDVEDRVIGHQTDGAIFIPEGFTARLLDEAKDTEHPGSMLEWIQLENNEGTRIMSRMLEEEVEELTLAARSAWSSGITEEQAVNWIKGLYEVKGKSSAEARTTDVGLYVNPALITSTGIFILFVMGLTGVTTSVIMSDRKNKVLQRMYAAPIREAEIAVGYFLGSFLVGTIQVGAALIVTRLILGFDFNIPLLSHWLVLECFLLAALGISAGMAGLIRKPSQLEALYSLLITPTCMIGGCFWPMDIMPASMQKLSNLVPQKWAMEAVARLAAGSGLLDIAYHLGILLLFAVLLLSFGSSLMKPGEDELF